MTLQGYSSNLVLHFYKAGRPTRDKSLREWIISKQQRLRYPNFLSLVWGEKIQKFCLYTHFFPTPHLQFVMHAFCENVWVSNPSWDNPDGIIIQVHPEAVPPLQIIPEPQGGKENQAFSIPGKHSLVMNLQKTVAKKGSPDVLAPGKW